MPTVFYFLEIASELIEHHYGESILFDKPHLPKPTAKHRCILPSVCSWQLLAVCP